MKSKEHELLENFKAQDADIEFLKGSNDFQIDVSHVSVSKVYGLSIKCPQLFNAVKELKAEGFVVEPQINYQDEKIILLATRTVLDSEGIDEST